MGRTWLGVVLVWLGLTGSAYAQGAPPAATDEVARNLFEAGRAAYDGGNYEDALSFFEQAYARAPRPQLLYNIGQAADRLRNDPKALASFKAYIAALPNAPNRVEVENRIRALERNLQAPSVATPPTATTATPAPAAPVAPTPSPAAEPMAPTPQQTAAAAPSPDPLQTPVPRASDNGGVTSKWWFWTAIGAVVVGGVVTAIALSSGDTTQGPLVGNSGVTATTLRGAP